MVILLLDIFCEMDFSDSVNALITQHESFMRSNAVILSLFFKQKKIPWVLQYDSLQN